MSFISSEYNKVLILFADATWAEYDRGYVIPKGDIIEAQVIIAITPSGKTDILKNRYGAVSA